MRELKWCPEMAMFTFRNDRHGVIRERNETESEWRSTVMSDDTRKVQNQLIAFAKSNPNQWISF